MNKERQSKQNSDEKAEAKKDQKPFRQKGGIYFHAGSIIGRKNTFVTNEYIQLLVNAFKLAELKQDVKNLAYVIMPNFFYWMFRLPENQEDPVAIYGEVKKNVAWEILTNLQAEVKSGAYNTLDIFKKNDRVGRSVPQKILWTFEEKAKKFKDNKRYRVWAPKTEIRLIDTPEMLRQKLEIIKKAPVSERWQLAKRAEDYPYLFLCDDLIESDKTGVVTSNVFTRFETASIVA